MLKSSKSSKKNVKEKRNLGKRRIEKSIEKPKTVAVEVDDLEDSVPLSQDVKPKSAKRGFFSRKSDKRKVEKPSKSDVHDSDIVSDGSDDIKAKNETKDSLKLSKTITTISFIVTFLVLFVCIFSFLRLPSSAANTSSSITFEIDPSVYKGINSFFDYYSNEEYKNQPSIIVENKIDEGNSPKNAFLSKDGKLYVVLDGMGYPVVETEDGLFVVEGRDIVGTEDADGNEIIAISDDGQPIIDYDADGNPIYGKSKHDVPISDALHLSENPRVSVDADGNYYYHIVWGDTLCKISSDLHYSVDEIADYNHIRNVNLIYAESDLRVPNDSDNPVSPYTRNSKRPSDAIVKDNGVVSASPADDKAELTEVERGEYDNAVSDNAVSEDSIIQSE